MSEWIAGAVPDIPKGARRRFLVTFESKRTGRRSVGELEYLNGHVMPLGDDCYEVPDCAKPHDPEPDGHCEEYEWTGWFSEYCEACSCSWVFHETFSKVIAHRELPEPFEEGGAE